MTDPLFNQQWGLQKIGAPSAWMKARGRGVTIAVVDSGVEAGHEDLAPRVVDSVSCIGSRGDPGRCGGGAGDDDGHGTHVAGIAAATQGNGAGIAGVAPEAKILAVRVLSRNCAPQVNSGELCRALGSTDDIRAGIRWAIAHGADVVNLSIGPDVATSTLRALPIADAVNEAWRDGVIVVVASGNDFSSVLGPSYDHLPLVIVGATDAGDQRPAYSNAVGDVRWGVSAPGGGTVGSCPAAMIISTFAANATSYRCLSGTSMAAPHVAGALALLRGFGLSPQAAVERLLTTSDDLGPPGPDTTFGFGRINLTHAFQGLSPPPNPTPPNRVHVDPTTRVLGSRFARPSPQTRRGVAGPAPVGDVTSTTVPPPSIGTGTGATGAVRIIESWGGWLRGLALLLLALVSGALVRRRRTERVSRAHV